MSEPPFVADQRSEPRNSATLFYYNRHLLVLSAAVLLVAGVSALLTMPRQEDPRITNRNPIILVPVPGASAERVEALVTKKLEVALQEIPEIKKVETTSRAGIAVFAIELDDAVDGETNEQIFSEIRDKINEARQQFPPEAQTPIFDDKRGAVAYTLIVALRWAHHSPPQLPILSRLAEDFADQLRLVPGTEIVRIFGEPEEEILVEVDKREIAALGLDTVKIAQLLRAADSKRPAGALRGHQSDLQLEVEGELDSVARVGSIPLQVGSEGQIVRLDDVASIKRQPRTPPAEIGFADGKRAVFVAARAREGRRVDLWAQQANTVLDRFAAETGASIAFERVFDQSGYTEERLGMLVSNLLAGAVVVVLVVLVVMGWKAALLVGSALPLTAAMTVWLIAGGGGQLHQMSIFGMIVALGLLIDNAIVTVDEIRKHLAQGASSANALTHALHHLFMPLLASTVTTIIAFMPIMLLPGNAGDFVSPIATSVIVALICSFGISMTIIAGLTAIFGCSAATGCDVWWRRGFRSTWLSNAYRRLIRWSLRQPAKGMGLACLVPAVGFALATQLGSQFFPATDRNMFHIRLWMPTDTAIAHTTKVTREVEAALREHPDTRRIDWLIGESFPSVYYNLLMNQDNSPFYAQAVVTATSAEAVKAMIPDIQRTLDQRFPQAQIVVRKFGQGPPRDSDIEFRIIGPSIAQLQDIGEAVRLALAQHPDVLHTVATMSRGEPKLWFEAREEDAKLAGLTLGEISEQMQAALEGTLGGSVVEDLEELPVRIRYRDGERADLRSVANSLLVASSPANGTGQGDSRPAGEATGTAQTSPDTPRWIPASALGEFKLRPELSGITRRNGERVNIIRGYTRQDALPIEVTRQVVAQINASDVRLPPGYRLELGGDTEQEGQAIGNLMVYLPVLITLMVAVLVLTFRSLTLAGLLVVVALISSGYGLLATWFGDYPISFNTILGTIGLIGLALNNSIVVLAAIRADAQARAGDLDALTNRVEESTRHIISTTLTTIGGFLPLLVFVGGDFWPPLAIVLAGGVGGSAILALIFAPAAHRLLTPLVRQGPWPGPTAPGA